MENGHADSDDSVDAVIDATDYQAEWNELARRLLVVSPHKMETVLDHVRALVEAQELIARADGRLVLRPDRPSKRYRA